MLLYLVKEVGLLLTPIGRRIWVAQLVVVPPPAINKLKGRILLRRSILGVTIQGDSILLLESPCRVKLGIREF